MYCIRCQQQYDSNQNVPRLLVMCGHTLCQKCCIQLHKNSKIQCFQCKTNTFIDRVASLPKNLALISLKKQAVKQCQKHNKRYQAFCSKQNILICIECILVDGHKNHEMDSISKSYERELVDYNKKVQKLQQYLHKIKQKTIQNRDNKIQSQKNYQKVNQIIQKTFIQIKQLIVEQEKSIRNQVYESFIANQNKFTQRSNIYDEKLDQIQTILTRIQADVQLNEADFLQQYTDRQQHLNMVRFITYDNLKPNSYSLTRNSLIENVLKTISNMKASKPSTCSAINNWNSLNVGGSQVQNVQKNITKGFSKQQSMKIVRKAAFSNISSYQPQIASRQKKISSRKQSISHHIQSPPVQINQIHKNIEKLQKQRVLKQHNGRQGSVLSSGDKKQDKKVIFDFNINRKIQIQNQEWSSVEPSDSLCHSFMSNMTSFLSDKSAVYVLGGFNDQNNNNIIKFNLQSMTWQNVQQLNNRSKFGSVFVDKKLFFFGGKKGKQRLNDVEAYDLQHQSWSKLPNMTKSKSGFGIALLEDQIVLIGGNDGENILSTVQSYNINTRQWKKLPSTNECRDELAVTVGKDNKIYAIGGFGGLNNAPLKSVEVYDPKIKEWRQISKMNYARRALSAAFLVDGIYAIGGFDGCSYMSSVEKYQQLNDQWIQISPMNVARCTHSSVSIYETQQIYVFGGFDFLPLSSVQRYSLINNQWQTISEMPFPRFMHSSILVRQ